MFTGPQQFYKLFWDLPIFQKQSIIDSKRWKDFFLISLMFDLFENRFFLTPLGK